LEKIKILHGVDLHDIPKDVIHSAEPVVFKNLVNDWPMVQAGRVSDQASVDYLKSFYNGNPTSVCNIPAPRRTPRDARPGCQAGKLSTAGFQVSLRHIWSNGMRPS
jgi:hypothetical protein